MTPPTEGRDRSYGQFAEDGITYEITDPATPRAFDNFLWNDAVMSCVHQTGVGTCDVQVDGSESIQVFTGGAMGLLQPASGFSSWLIWP